MKAQEIGPRVQVLNPQTLLLSTLSLAQGWVPRGGGKIGSQSGAWDPAPALLKFTPKSRRWNICSWRNYHQKRQCPFSQKKKRMNFTWHKHFVPGFQEKIVGNVVLMGCWGECESKGRVSESFSNQVRWQCKRYKGDSREVVSKIVFCHSARQRCWQ